MTTPRTFAPPTGPSFQVPIGWDFPGSLHEPEKPYDVFVPSGDKPVEGWQIGWKFARRPTHDYVVSFFHDIGGPAEMFFWTPPVKHWSPSSRAPDSGQVAGGSLSGRTLDYAFTWFDVASGQESLPSPVGTATFSANNLAVLTIPRYPAGVKAARIYVATSELEDLSLQGYITGSTWTEPAGGHNPDQGVPPTAATLYTQALFKLRGGVERQYIDVDLWAITLRFFQMFQTTA